MHEFIGKEGNRRQRLERREERNLKSQIKRDSRRGEYIEGGKS